MTGSAQREERYSAWNPGLESHIPPAYRALETIFRPENVSSALAEVDELARRTGLRQEELVVFRPERLVLHELIVRVSADIVVLEGEDEEDLGKNFRRIARHVLSRYIQPQMASLSEAHRGLYAEVHQRVQRELEDSLFAATPPRRPPRRGGLFGWLGRSAPAPAPVESVQERELRIVQAFRGKGLQSSDPLQRAIYKSLYRVLGSMAAARGYLGPDRDLLARLVSQHVCNDYGSRMIGRLIAPLIEAAVRQEGYARVADAETPILISLKGASAAGKSSLRPMLRQMMIDQGIGPDGYATISPDIWRRLLLDYASLGEAYKYSGRLTSNELIVIDGKLDRYIRDKAERNRSIPHLIVDRFRFDSFASEKISRILHETYAKYVDTMYMYFIVTPPEATVERGWERGLTRGRFKAVEDFLDHSVEAYLGMPKILFKWLAYDRPLFRYEFLDNSVPKGTYPNCIAFGTQKEINIVNPVAFVDMERYQKINIKARSPQEVYPRSDALSIRQNLGFLKQCIRRIPVVNFVDDESSSVYARTRAGVFEVVDPRAFENRLDDGQMAEIFAHIAPRALQRGDPD